MYSIVYNFYFLLRRYIKRCRETGRKERRLVIRVIDRIEWYYNVVVRKKMPWNEKKYSFHAHASQRGQEKIIASLTSYPKRIQTSWISIETLMRQTVPPDEIILWLARDQFPEQDNDLPDELKRLKEKGIQIKYCDDLKSHKKYFYVLQEYKDAIVLLFDDDMFYPFDTIERLMKLHRKYPLDVCTMSAQKMGDKDELPSQWRNPSLHESVYHSNTLQVFTGSGSLFPPRSIPTEAFNETLIMEICPYADDLWLTAMLKKNGRCVTASYPWRAFPITIYGTIKGSLWYINSESGGNDDQWRAILNNLDSSREG